MQIKIILDGPGIFADVMPYVNDEAFGSSHAEAFYGFYISSYTRDSIIHSRVVERVVIVDTVLASLNDKIGIIFEYSNSGELNRVSYIHHTDTLTNYVEYGPYFSQWQLHTSFAIKLPEYEYTLYEDRIKCGEAKWVLKSSHISIVYQEQFVSNWPHATDEEAMQVKLAFGIDLPPVMYDVTPAEMYLSLEDK